MRSALLTGFALLLATLLPPAQASAPAAGSLLVLLPPTPGLFAQGRARNEVGGPGAEALRRIGVAAALPLQLGIAVGLRSHVEAQRREGHCTTSARSPEREPLYRWIGPVGRARMLLYARADDPRRPAALGDLAAGVRIGATSGSLPAALLVKRGLKVETEVDEARNIDRLARGEIDYWAANELTSRHELQARKRTAEVRKALDFGSVDIYLACNPNTPKAWVERLNQASRQLAAQGELKALGLSP